MNAPWLVYSCGWSVFRLFTCFCEFPLLLQRTFCASCIVHVGKSIFKFNSYFHVFLQSDIPFVLTTAHGSSSPTSLPIWWEDNWLRFYFGFPWWSVKLNDFSYVYWPTGVFPFLWTTFPCHLSVATGLFVHLEFSKKIRYNLHIILYLFQVYNVMIWIFVYIVKCSPQ